MALKGNSVDTTPHVAECGTRHPPPLPVGAPGRAGWNLTPTLWYFPPGVQKVIGQGPTMRSSAVESRDISHYSKSLFIHCFF